MVFSVPGGRDVHALSHVSLDLAPGEIVSVLGPVGLRQDHAAEHRGGVPGADRGAREPRRGAR